MVYKNAVTLAMVHCCLSAAAASVDKRIVNGEVAKAGDFPYMVSIRRANGFHNCGGVLLDSTTVLSAAHCLDDFSSASVRAGTLSRTEGGVDVEVASRKQHPDFNGSYRPGEPLLPNDIGILKLKSPIEKSDSISYATLPARGSDPAAGSMALIAGWGTNETMVGDDADFLNKGTIPILTRQNCTDLEKEAGGRDSIVCVGGGSQSVCKYDSGGPLVDEETGQVIGVSSWIITEPGYQAGHPVYCNRAPAVFTRVGSYVPFILENLGTAASGAAGDSPKRPEQPEAEVRLREHCERAGNDAKTCMRAGFRCSGQVRNDAPIEEFLECVDRMQVCSDQGDGTDKCIAKARECKGKEKLPLGDVAKLVECVKSGRA